MEHHIVRGNPVQVNWTFNSIAGGEFSLAGYYYRLYYLQGTQSVLATGVTHSGNTLTWSFIPDNQWKSGYYDIMLEIYSSTKKILTITYPEVFNLVPAATTSETSTAVQNAVSTIDIESSCDFNRFTPVIPTVGNDNKWYVDGEPVLDPSGHQVYATGKGVASINKTATSGNIDTYTITYTDNTTQSFTVTNGIDGEDGIGITNIAKTSTSGNVDIYTITMTDGQTYTFNVTNGIDGEDGDAATLEVDSVTVSTGAAGSTASVNVENVGDENAARLQFSFTIPKGDKGDTGNGLIIKGKVATTNNLPSSNRQVGDAYLCEADNYIYIWSGSDWFTMSTTGYQKPSTGIPLEDLSSSVQTSLGKADSALQSHQSISGKADKVSSATNNNFAALDANGNLKDSGKKASDFASAATTLAGYGITDANISNGTITLGSNTITPLTSHQGIKTINGNTITGTGNVAVGNIRCESAAVTNIVVLTESEYTALATKVSTTLYILTPDA